MQIGGGNPPFAPGLCHEMTLHEPQYFSDDLARDLAVVKQVERVRRHRVIYDRDGQVSGQRLDQEPVESLVQTRHLVLTCSCNEQREIPRKIRDRFPGARVDEPELPGRISDPGGSVEIEHVPAARRMMPQSTRCI